MLQQQPRQPRIVAELGSFASSTAIVRGGYQPPYAFRRVHSSPNVGPEAFPVNPRKDDDLKSIEGGASLSVGASKQYISDRPPTPTSVLLNASSGEDDVEGDRNRACVSPALSSASSGMSGPTSASLRQLCHAIQQNGPRPTNLSLEEKGIWDAMHVARRQARQEGMQQAKEQQQELNYSLNHTEDSFSRETRFVEIQEQAVSQQRDNSRSLQAIQRVLADVQAERDQAVLRLQDYRQPHSDDPAGSCSSSVSNTVADERETMRCDLHVMPTRIVSLERELRRNDEPEIKVTVEPYADSPVSALQHVMDDELTRDAFDQQEREKEALARELEWKDKEIVQLEQQVAILAHRKNTDDSVNTSATLVSTSQTSDVRLDAVRKELSEKASALENAKMIIASLENASGSLAADLRRKLRDRDGEMAQIQKELAEKHRTLDTLAKELRDLQKVKTAAAPIHNTEAAQIRRLQLSSRLETNLAEIRAAAVILESTQDATAVSNLSELLTDSASALKEGIDVIENGVADDRRGPLRLHRDLEEKKKAIQRLEEILRKQTSEAGRFKTTIEDTLRRRDEELYSLHAEIKILRQQCSTNMEVLTRKERELAVLRDSLRVEDDDVGYISDDDPDDDEPPPVPSPPSTLLHQMPFDYGPSQAEALATLLSHGGNHSFDSGSAAVAQSAFSKDQHAKEIDVFKAELSSARADYEKAQRQLKVEKESLSNAKMIISSLERASKGMMEDLRARLQDSNTAIASLLEKSMESETSCSRLRLELEAMKREQRAVVEETALALALTPPPTPLLLTETID